MLKKKYNYILAFGSNVGERTKNLLHALNRLEEFVVIEQQSHWHETMPLTHPVYNTDDHNYYINFVAQVTSELDPQQLYSEIVNIEDAIGHPRTRRWMPRAIDIDILFCAFSEDKPFSKLKPHIYFKTPDFHVPHREYFKRKFWQEMVENELHISKETILKHFNLN